MRLAIIPVLTVAFITASCAGGSTSPLASSPRPTSSAQPTAAPSIARATAALPSERTTSTPIATETPTQSPEMSEAPSVTPGMALFRPGVTLAEPIDPIVVADFNADGLPDIAGVDQEDGSVSLVLGTGGGAFAPAVKLPGGDGPPAIASGDLNSDGRLDIVLTHTGVTDRGSGADDIVVLLAKGDGTFARLVRPAGENPEAVVVDDFNGDGKPDLATANNGDHVSIFLGRGDGKFQDPLNYPIGAPFSGGIATSDFNGDGNLDLVTANSIVGRGRSARTMTILRGNGDGTFLSPDVYDVNGPQPVVPVVADFNDDGAPDVAMPDGYPTHNVSVLLNQGDGSFSTSVEYASGANPHTLVTADLDADGHADLVAGNIGEGGGPVGKGVSVLFGRGDGTFEPEIELFAGGLGEQISVAADLDGDELLDLIVPGYLDLLLFFNTGLR